MHPSRRMGSRNIVVEHIDNNNNNMSTKVGDGCIHTNPTLTMRLTCMHARCIHHVIQEYIDHGGSHACMMDASKHLMQTSRNTSAAFPESCMHARLATLARMHDSEKVYRYIKLWNNTLTFKTSK